MHTAGGSKALACSPAVAGARRRLGSYQLVRAVLLEVLLHAVRQLLPVGVRRPLCGLLLLRVLRRALVLGQLQARFQLPLLSFWGQKANGCYLGVLTSPLDKPRKSSLGVGQLVLRRVCGRQSC